MFMDDAGPHAHAAALSALTALGVEMASNIQAAALTAEAAEDKHRLATAFARVARSVRQSIALDAKLAREARQAAREAAQDGRRAVEAEGERRRKRVKLSLEREIWNEAEGEDAERLLDALDEQLDLDELSELAGESVEAQIERIRAGLGLTGVPLEEAADDEDDEDDDDARASGGQAAAEPDDEDDDFWTNPFPRPRPGMLGRGGSDSS
jgi:hypothetical protein